MTRALHPGNKGIKTVLDKAGHCVFYVFAVANMEIQVENQQEISKNETIQQSEPMPNFYKLLFTLAKAKTFYKSCR